MVPLLTFWCIKARRMGVRTLPKTIAGLHVDTGDFSAATIDTWETVGLGRMHRTLGDISRVLQGLECCLS